jgi:MOSC domain-containing protein YiiM
MELISVNLGRAQAIQYAQKSGITGIYKQPVSHPVEIGTLGLQDDAVIDVENHGGPDQAVYVYTSPDYAWWSQQLGYALTPGTFGDNLTISALESAACKIGDRLHVGDVILEVTSPRIPCSTLAARMGDMGFVKRYRYAERPGLYCRVIRPGQVMVGDPVSLKPYTGPTVSILEMFRDYYVKSLDEAALRRYLSAPIAIRSRVDLEEKLHKPD